MVQGARIPRKKTLVKKLLASLAAVAVGIVGFQVPAQAAVPVLRFTLVQYDAPGSDSNSVASVNGEYVAIHNPGSATVNITGLTVRDEGVHRYKIPSYLLGAKKTIYIHTGKGRDGYKPDGVTRDSARRYMQSGWHVWNNTGDTAMLYNATSGRVFDTCKWTRLGTGKTSC